MVRVHIGLGSNLSDPLRQVRTAVEELAGLPESRLVRASPWYLSRAVGPGTQPDYVNGVAAVDTALPAERLLDELQALERAHRRLRAEKWGPRTLDLDILLYGDRVIETPRLQIPHPWLTRRNFVILPLADVAAGLILPDGTPIDVLVQSTSRDGIRPLAES